MKQKLYIIVTSAVLAFSGCAQTAPDAPGAGNVMGTSAITGETGSIVENAYDNEGNNGLNTNGLGGNGKYNSSSDGFRSVYFAFGDYGIASSMASNMNTNIQVANSTGARIKIEGNCDEFGTDEYNYALGLKRAKAVKDSLVSQGIVSSKMVMVSFGESTPICQEQSDSCYDRNRRVDIRLVR